MAHHTYVVTGRPALIQHVHRQLDALKAARDDEHVGADLVGEVLGTI